MREVTLYRVDTDDEATRNLLVREPA
jgi:hypothetical protein